MDGSDYHMAPPPNSTPTAEDLIHVVNQLRLELQNIHTSHEEELRAIRAALSTSTPTPTAPPISTAPPAPPIIPSSTELEGANQARHVLPKLEKFDGSNRKAFLAWKYQVEAKLNVDYSNASSYIRGHVVFSALSGAAAAAIVPYSDRGEVANAEDILTKLTEIYYSSSYIAEAEQRFRTLRQGSRDYTSFEEEFRRLAIEVGAFSWPESTKMETFKRAIHINLRRALEGAVATIPDATLQTWMDSARRLSTSTTGFKGFIPSSSSGSSSLPPVINDTMDWESTRRTTSSSPPRASSSSNGSDSRRRAKWVSQEEMSRRRRLHLCYRCGASSHGSNTCPYTPARNPNFNRERARVASSPPPISKPMLEDKEELKE
jgi:hypothetical protein